MAPKPNAPIADHKKHVEDFLKIDKHKHEPKDRQLHTDAPNEDPNHQPKDKE